MKTVVPPWETMSSGVQKVKMTLSLEAEDKVRLDYLSRIEERPAQVYLRRYIEVGLRADAKAAWLKEQRKKA